jgi:C-terminal processing protease CtpA/Prc
MQSAITPEERRAATARGLARINHAFERVERLPGNIGYIAFTGFTDVEAAAATVASVMSFVANTDALIFDLRRTGGGTPEMVALLASYLVGPDSVHINTMHWREGDSTRQFWTRPHVAGPRYLTKPVYLLTSKRTFSAAEEFAYDLQSLRRATVVGETTGGGAHPGMLIQFLKEYQIFIPMGRAINPVTKTDWEGTGVRPEIPVAAERSLDVARLAALRRVLPSTVDPEARAEAQAEITRLSTAVADSSPKR